MSNAYLLTWNPEKWDFEEGYPAFLQRVNNGEKPVLEWRAANSSIQKGDVLYLMRLGVSPRGIILKGIAMGGVHLSKHYDVVRAEAGEMVNRVTVQFVSGGNFLRGEYLDWDTLKERFPNQNWTPQASGIKILDGYSAELDNMWDHINKRVLSKSDIRHNVVIIKINQTYHKGMSPRELYEYTRGFWKRKIDSVKSAQYALSVVDGEVIEVYKIDRWIHASEADNLIRKFIPEKHSNRIAFEGDVATDEIRSYYLGRNVNALYKWGEADPVKLILAYSERTSSNNINEPMMPKKTFRKSDGTIQYICARCETAFIRASRCPDCGQLVQE